MNYLDDMEILSLPVKIFVRLDSHQVAEECQNVRCKRGQYKYDDIYIPGYAPLPINLELSR